MRTKNGQFQKGHSGNPSGRPRNTSSKIRELLNEHSEEIVSYLMDEVRKGDSTAIKIGLDKIIPSLKPSTASVEFMDSDLDNLSILSDAIVKAQLAGDLDANDASKMLEMIVAKSQVDKIQRDKEFNEQFKIFG